MAGATVVELGGLGGYAQVVYEYGFIDSRSTIRLSTVATIVAFAALASLSAAALAALAALAPSLLVLRPIRPPFGTADPDPGAALWPIPSSMGQGGSGWWRWLRCVCGLSVVQV